MSRSAALADAPTVRPAKRDGGRVSVLGLLGNLLFGVIILAVAAAVLALTVLPGKLQYQAYIVLTGSMTPTIPVGSIVLVIPANPRTIQVGDVVSFTRNDPGREPVTITHRVNQILPGDSRFPTFQTKGDANPVPDAEPVRYLGPAGKVVGWVPYAGQFFLFGRTTPGKTLMLTVPGALLAIALLWSIWKPRPKAAPEVTEDGDAVVVRPAPAVSTRFQFETLARAYALVGDPILTNANKAAALQQLAKRAERAGDQDLAAWLDDRVGELIPPSILPAQVSI